MINLDLGILYLFAVSELAVYGIFLSGWASGSKYSLLGSLRSSASLISYELGLGLALLAPVLLVGSLNLNDIVNWQKEHGWLFLYAFPAFLVYLIASMAEAARTPLTSPRRSRSSWAGTTRSTAPSSGPSSRWRSTSTSSPPAPSSPPSS